VDRAALPAPGSTADAGSAQPSTVVETMLVEIYAAVLGLDQTGVDASFFDVGGNSLKAMQLVGRLEQEMGLDVPVADVFLAPQPRELARLLCAKYGLRDAELDVQALQALASGEPVHTAAD
jgi:acyl carrier protein